MSGLELKVARIKHGISQNEMAVRLGESPSSYAKKEQGRVRVSIEQAIKIARILDMSPGEFDQVFLDGYILDYNTGNKNGKRRT